MSDFPKTIQQLTEKLSLIAQGMALAERYIDATPDLPLRLRNEGEEQKAYYINELANVVKQLQRLLNTMGGQHVEN